ncbi:hypothetical protein [Paenibacillus sp. BK720]|uniref:hypothetical protein n=1 Tax=Paenibacillus sp. BK720 TaxID=2587092 RepID=UPI00141F1014|nr:hypothetical protein [Paenibacillus sp. BK720]NIK67930.1 hypothetical protein [Paenibacillus sp. BK720]
MPYVLVTAAGVTLKGAYIAVDQIVELSDKSASALIAEGKAIEATPTGVSADVLDDKVPGEGNTPGNQEDDTAAEIERQKKALADQYNLDGGGTKPGLKDAALAAGVDFPYDVTKGDLIDLIVAQGKAVDLVK